MAAVPKPAILHPIELTTFVQHAIHKIPGQLHLIICSTQEAFTQELLASIKHEQSLALEDARASGLSRKRLKRVSRRKHDLFVPTLRQLANAKDVCVTFCETLPQLMAYLSVYEFPAAQNGDNSARRTIALQNPITLHRSISSFSAQGLSRTFASVVEAASHAKARLLVVECSSRIPAPPMDTEMRSDDDAMDSNPPTRVLRGGDPWEEEVSLLNVTTKSFGAGERGWVGRTVKVRTVAERWFVFKDPRSL